MNRRLALFVPIAGPRFALAFAFAFAVALGSACLHVAEGRAERDLRVGHLEAHGAEVHVDEGLAVVRALEDDRVELWANAPSVRFALTTPAGPSRTWTLRLRNVLADAALTASTPALVTITHPTATDAEARVELPGGVRTDFTWAAPDADRREPWRFAAMADVQEAIDRVDDVYGVMNADPSIRFVVFNGDLTSQGTDAQLTKFEAKLGALHVPLYATLGNHELGTRDDAFHDYFGRGSSSFAFRGVRFTLLDSASATLDPMVYGWLDGWIERAAGDLHVVTMHIPPLDPIGERSGAFASRAEANKLVARLAEGGVDLTIYGHVHSYYAYENGGIPAFITGGGGAIPERMDGIGRHYLTVDADPVAGTLRTGYVPID